jgi:hypothetical protein
MRRYESEAWKVRLSHQAEAWKVPLGHQVEPGKFSCAQYRLVHLTEAYGRDDRNWRIKYLEIYRTLLVGGGPLTHNESIAAQVGSVRNITGPPLNVR